MNKYLQLCKTYAQTMLLYADFVHYYMGFSIDNGVNTMYNYTHNKALFAYKNIFRGYHE